MFLESVGMESDYLSSTISQLLAPSNSTNPLHARPALPYSMGVTILLGLAAGIISLVTISGNTIVILSFFLEQSIRQPTNYFIASLAVSDLLIGAVSMPFYTVYLLTGQYWPLNEFLCNVWLTVDYTACMCSIYTVFSITVDRYCSVKIPAKYRIWRTKKKVLVVIACIWSISVLLFFSSIFLWQTWISDRKLELGKCYVFYLEDALFNCSVQIGYFWITIMAMITLYIAIYRVALDLQRKSEEKHRKTAAVVTQINTSAAKTALVKSETGLDTPEISQVKGKTPSPTEDVRLLDKRFFNQEDHGTIKHTCIENSSKDKLYRPSAFQKTPSIDQKEENYENNSQKCSSLEISKNLVNSGGRDELQVSNIDQFIDQSKEIDVKSNSERIISDVELREAAIIGRDVILKQSFSIDFKPGRNQESVNELSSSAIKPVKSWSFDGILENFVKIKLKQGKFKRLLKENKQLFHNSDKTPPPNHSSQCTANNSKETETGRKSDLTLLMNLSVQLTEMTGLNMKMFSTPQMSDIGRKLASKLSISSVLRSIRVPEALHEFLNSKSLDSQTSSEVNDSFNVETNKSIGNEGSIENVLCADSKEEKSILCSAKCESENINTNVVTFQKKMSLKRNQQDFRDTANLLNSSEDEVELNNAVDICSQTILNYPQQPENDEKSSKETPTHDHLVQSLPPQSLPISSTASNRIAPIDEQAPSGTPSAPISWRTNENLEAARSPTKSVPPPSFESTNPRSAGEFIRTPFCRQENKRSSLAQQSSQSGAYASHQKHKRANRARKALRTITIILGAFIVCFLPWHVLSMIMGFCPKNMTCVSPMLYDISYWLCYLNSPINPFCYALANEQFKRTFARILRLDWHRI